MHYEQIRRRIKTARTELKDAPFHPSMMGKYYQGDSSYTDDDGVLHIFAPGRLTPLGEKMHMPFRHLIFDARARSLNDAAKTDG